MDDINEIIESSIDLREFYSEYLEADFDDDGRVEKNITCPLHDDKTPSLSMREGRGGKCYGCGKSFSGPIGFYSLWMERDGKKYSFKRAQKKLYSRYIHPLVDGRIAANWHAALIKNLEARKVLEDRGIALTAVKKFQIGWDSDSDRFTVPVENEFGWIHDIRKIKTKEYMSSPPTKKEKQYKNMPYDKGYAKGGYSFPVTNSYKGVLYLCEGEFDAIVLCMNGFNAITTGGCQVMKNQYYLFKNKDVVLCLDNDDAGKSAAQILLRELYNLAKTVCNVEIPIKGGDVTDFFSAGHSKDDFKKLVNNAKEKAKIAEPIKLPAVGSEVVSLDRLEDIHNPFNFGKRAILTARLVADKEKRYSIAVKYEVRCTMDKGNACRNCSMLEHGGEIQHQVKPGSPDFLAMIDAKDTAIHSYMLEAVDAPARCNRTSIEVAEVTSVILGKIAPNVRKRSDNKESAHQDVLILCGRLELNSDYILTGTITKDPNGQSTVFVIEKAIKTETTFGANNAPERERAEELKQKFNPETDTVDSILERHSEINDILSRNVTNIYGREELHSFVNLAYFSPLHLQWEPNTKPFNSYIDLVVLGDTNTGKNAVVDALCEYYGRGRVVDSASCTRAGLLGAFDENGYYSWGIYPQQHGKLICLDEGSNLSEMMKTLRSIREGRADYVKAGGDFSTVCETRCIILTNAPNHTLSSYPYPITALPAIFEHEADISRFDLACFLRGEDNPSDIINAEKPPRIETEITQADFQDVLSFAWSVTHEQIKFSKAAIKEVYENATRLGKKYSSKIPLIQDATVRDRIAAWAASLANQMFNWDMDKEFIKVTKSYVKAAVKIVEDHYDSEACQYNIFSQQEFSKGVLTNRKSIVGVFDKEKNYEGTNISNCLKNILSTNICDYDYFNDNFMSLETSTDVRQVIKLMVINRCLIRDGKYYVKTFEFTKLIKKLLKKEEAPRVQAT